MKLSLGGKLSIGIALTYMILWTVTLKSPEDADRLKEFCVLALYVLSLPIGWLGGFFGVADPPYHMAQRLLVRHLLLTIPNCFLLGYSLAGVLNGFRRVWSHFAQRGNSQSLPDPPN